MKSALYFFSNPAHRQTHRDRQTDTQRQTDRHTETDRQNDHITSALLSEVIIKPQVIKQAVPTLRTWPLRSRAGRPVRAVNPPRPGASNSLPECARSDLLSTCRSSRDQTHGTRSRRTSGTALLCTPSTDPTQSATGPLRAILYYDGPYTVSDRSATSYTILQ